MLSKFSHFLIPSIGIRIQTFILTKRGGPRSQRRLFYSFLVMHMEESNVDILYTLPGFDYRLGTLYIRQPLMF